MLDELPWPANEPHASVTIDNQTAHNSLSKQTREMGRDNYTRQQRKVTNRATTSRGQQKRAAEREAKRSKRATRPRNEKRCQEKNSGETARQGRQDNKRIQADKITRQTR